MPNYCNNIVHLRHEDPAQLTRVVNAYMRGKLLNEFVPIDEEDPEWYELRLSKWGCKWDVEPYDKDNPPEVKDNSVTLMFDSPWSPPFEVFTKMVEEDGFDIKAYYYSLQGFGKMAVTIIMKDGVMQRTLARYCL